MKLITTEMVYVNLKEQAQKSTCAIGKLVNEPSRTVELSDKPTEEFELCDIMDASFFNQ